MSTRHGPWPFPGSPQAEDLSGSASAVGALEVAVLHHPERRMQRLVKDPLEARPHAITRLCVDAATQELVVKDEPSLLGRSRQKSVFEPAFDLHHLLQVSAQPPEVRLSDGPGTCESARSPTTLVVGNGGWKTLGRVGSEARVRTPPDCIAFYQVAIDCPAWTPASCVDRSSTGAPEQ